MKAGLEAFEIQKRERHYYITIDASEGIDSIGSRKRTADRSEDLPVHNSHSGYAIHGSTFRQ